jgi:hypothetical protein
VPDDPLTEAERDQILRDLARLLPAAVLDPWEEIHLSYSAVGDAATVSCTVVRVDGSMSTINAPYRATRLLPDLRAGMFEPGRGTWFSMRCVVEQSGQHRVLFDYDGEPELDFTLADSSYAVDLARFPRDEAHLPDWLKEKLAAFTGRSGDHDQSVLRGQRPLRDQ